MGAKKTYTCANCGTQFEDYPSRRETRGRETFYCSRECKHDHERTGEYRECATCGDDVYVPECHLEQSSDGYSIDRHFCDKECESEYRKEHWVGENHPNWNGGKATVECDECASEFEVTPAKVGEAKYCSRGCAAEGQSNPKTEVECSWCGKEYKRYAHNENKTEHNLCSDECYSNWMSEQRRGSANPAWKGGKSGITAVRRMLGERSWNHYARQTRKDAGHVCEMCGEFQPHRKLAGHHIIPVASGGVNEQWCLMLVSGVPLIDE